MNITRVFAHAIVRRIAFVIVAAALAWIGIGRAQAAVPPNPCPIGAPCTQAQAYAAAIDAARADLVCANGIVNTTHSDPMTVTVPTSQSYGSHYGCKNVGGTVVSQPTQREVFYHAGCPAPSVWDEPTKQCHDPSACLAKPPLSNKAVRNGSTICSNGCVYSPKNNGDNNPNELNFCLAGGAYCGAKTWEATGAACASGSPPETRDPNKDTCVALANGYGECVKPDGQHCWTSSAGQTTCWRPGETGPRTTADAKFGSDRKAAPSAPTAPTNMPSPQVQGSSTTTINNTTYNSSSYSSSGGGDGQPGQPNTGVDGDNDGDGKPDDGGSASGGGSCAAPPSCSGDPVACAAVNQAWLARCGETKADADGDGRPDWTQLGSGEGSEGIEADGTEKAKEWDFPGLDMLDDSGFIGASCPAFPTMDFGPLGQFDASTDFWCNWIEILGAVFLFIFAVAALAVLVS